MREAEMREAEERIYKKGYILENMVEPFNDLFEIVDKNCKVVMDDLSPAQVEQLAKIL